MIFQRKLTPDCAPRMRGDEPDLLDDGLVDVGCSPHARG